jgi:16S rRNA processing protein RimM
MQQYLEAGKVVTTHGVRGEMKLELWCDGVDFLKKVGRLYPSAQGGKAYKILSIRPQGQMALLQLEGVSDMDAARALRGQVFYFDRNDATLPAGRWYVADLIGCEVRDADTGKVYGVVTSVDHPGAQDIYTVKAPGGKEYMFPGVDAFLKERNPPEGYILVTPIRILASCITHLSASRSDSFRIPGKSRCNCKCLPGNRLSKCIQKLRCAVPGNDPVCRYILCFRYRTA